ncbi:MAG: glycoside hydrolase family 36 protein [bacterium]
MKSRIVSRIVNTVFLLSLGSCIPFASGQDTEQKVYKTPPNKPARWEWDGKTFMLEYGGETIFKGTVENFDDRMDFNRVEQEEDGKVDQVFIWTSRTEPLKLAGKIVTSEEGFPCEAERKENGLLLIRHSVGMSFSLLNRAVYDRRFDWVLSVDPPTRVVITPETDSDSNAFRIEISGRILILRFRPRYYQKHRGLTFFEPWTYRVWPKPVAGWCSWFAYLQDITEQDVRHTADVLAEDLVPFGLEYLQIDDGYQQDPAGTPETWLVPNEKFPSGLKSLSAYIKERGMKPGIWTYTSFHQKDWAESHPRYFVLNEKGKPAYGNWVGYVMDGSNPATLNDIIRPLYGGFREMGWEYFKVDALRHLKNEGYNSFSDYFRKKKLDRVDVYRRFVRTIRDEIGKDRFMLGCWGIRPELAGIIDGCRIGTDGFGYGGLAQYNSFNNVVWRNDPDHIELSEGEAFRSCMATSLTGSLYMLTDKPEVYKTEIVEAAKRTLPVPFTLPCQVYDVDPSHSMHLHRADTELSGSGPRLLDADQRPYCHLYLLEINKPFESWVVLGRTGGDIASVRFEDIGLPAEDEYLVFEFWTKRYTGSFTDAFPLGEIDPKYGCQVYAIRKRLDHPQVLATSRHITCGVVDLESMVWEEGSLSGVSQLVGGDPYTLFLTEPAGYRLKEVRCEGASVIDQRQQSMVRTVRFESETNSKVRWVAVYEKEKE